MFKSKYRPGRVLKQGLLNLEGEPYPLVVESVQKTNQEIAEAVRQLNR